MANFNDYFVDLDGRPTVTNFNDYFLEADAAGPHHIEFLRSGAVNTTPRGLRPGQLAAQRGARTETRRNLARFKKAGLTEEFEEFEARDGNTLFGSEILGGVDTTFEDILGPAFDLLQIGQFTAAGAVQEYLRTNSAYEALKQAGIEFANALPGIELEEAKRPSFGNILNPQGDDKWSSAIGGFVLDVLLDPLTYIPGGLVAKGLTKIPMAAKAGIALKSSRPGRFLRQKFVADSLFKDEGIAGEAFIQVRKKFEQQDLDNAFHIVEATERIYAKSSPHERLLLRAYYDQPKVLEDQLVKIADAGGPIERSRIPDVMKLRDQAAEHNERLWIAGVDEGWFDSAAFRDEYIYEGRGITRFSNRVFDKATRKNLLPTSGSVNPGKASFAIGRKDPSRTTEQRLESLFAGESGIPIELDMAANQAARSLMQSRISNSHEFIQAVIKNPNISAALVDVEHFGAGALLKSGKPIWTNPGALAKFKKDLPAVYDVLEIKRFLPKKGKKVDEFTIKKGKKGKRGLKGLGAQEIREKKTIAAYVLPDVIVREVTRMDKLWTEGDELTKFVDTLEKATSLWRGYATLSTGFVLRNYQGILMQNWQAGVGTDYKKWLRGEFPVPGQFLMRHMQALKLQVLDQGPGQLPKWAQKALKSLGVDDIDNIEIKLDGKVLTRDEELAFVKRGRAEGVSQSATRLANLPEDFEGIFLTKLEKDLGKAKVDIKDTAELLPVTRRLLEAIPGENITTRMVRWFGNNNPVLQANRAFSQIVENNGRWALYLDRMMKGEPAHRAKKATTDWHYDYRNLTDFEKKVGRNIFPFYAWMRFNTPRQFHALMNNPGRYAKIPKLKDAIERLSPDWDDIPTPDYFEEIHAVQLGKWEEDRHLYFRPDLPIMDINRVNYKDVMSSLTPFIKTFSESMPREGYSIFLEGPLERFPGERSAEIPAITRKTQFVLETLLPTFGKVTRALKASERGDLGKQFMTEFLGVKLLSPEVRRVIRGNDFKKRKLTRDFKRKMIDEGKLKRQ